MAGTFEKIDMVFETRMPTLDQLKVF